MEYGIIHGGWKRQGTTRGYGGTRWESRILTCDVCHRFYNNIFIII